MTVGNYIKSIAGVEQNMLNAVRHLATSDAKVRSTIRKTNETLYFTSGSSSELGWSVS
jgi:hypothetical protein